MALANQKKVIECIIQQCIYGACVLGTQTRVRYANYWCYHGTTCRIGVEISTLKRRLKKKTLHWGPTLTIWPYYFGASGHNWPLLTLCEARNEYKMSSNRISATTEDDPSKNEENQE